MPGIIIEGCDAVGKTALVNEISEYSGLRKVQGSSFNIAQMGNEYLFKHMNEILDKSLIIDRLHYSNRVYSQIFTPNLSLTNEQYENIDRKIKDTNTTVVYVHSSIEVIKKRLSIRGDDYVDPDDIELIMEKYAETLGGKEDIIVLNSDNISNEWIEEKAKYIIYNHLTKKII